MTEAVAHAGIEELSEFRGKAVIVTGGARGVGFATCAQFRAAGAHVLIADANEATAVEACARLKQAANSGGVEYVAVDVSIADDVDAMASACVERFGRLDVLVNNAAIFPFQSIREMTPDLIRRVLDVNLVGLMLATKAAANRMIELGNGGAIVNVAARDAFKPLTIGLGAYGASKGGIVTFTKHAALEFAPYGIRVTAVAPGAVATEGAAEAMAASGLPPEQLAQLVEQTLARLPLGRAAEPDEIASIIVFLASGKASMILGDTILAEGGAVLS